MIRVDNLHKSFKTKKTLDRLQRINQALIAALKKG